MRTYPKKSLHRRIGVKQCRKTISIPSIGIRIRNPGEGGINKKVVHPVRKKSVCHSTITALYFQIIFWIFILAVRQSARQIR